MHGALILFLQSLSSAAAEMYEKKLAKQAEEHERQNAQYQTMMQDRRKLKSKWAAQKAGTEIKGKKMRGKKKRAYGTDAYWIERYSASAPADADDVTDEWLMGAAQLAPLLGSLPANAAVIDLGCGTSTLIFDLLRDCLRGEQSRALGVDIALGAVERLREEQRARARLGEASALRAELHCADLT